ncbi:nitroreductase family protein [Haloferula sargassicola]
MYYDVILLAHTVEKGLSQPSPRPRFGKQKIVALLDLCDRYRESWDQFPIEKTYGALLAYIEWHMNAKEPMGELESRIVGFVSRCRDRGLVNRGGTKLLPQTAMERTMEKGGGLLESRYSCRKFDDRIVSREVVERVISIAQRAPSQCNRQSSRVHCYQNHDDIQGLLKLQKGASGFAEGVRNLFVVTSDMAAWSGCNARNQSFVDGSLFAMQLALACSSLGIGSCALNLAVGNARERLIRIAGNIPHGERLILMMAFGYPDCEEALIVAKSERISLDVVATFHNH